MKMRKLYIFQNIERMVWRYYTLFDDVNPCTCEHYSTHFLMRAEFRNKATRSEHSMCNLHSSNWNGARTNDSAYILLALKDKPVKAVAEKDSIQESFSLSVEI